MSILAKLLTLLAVFIALGAGLVLWQARYAHHDSDTTITKEEMELLLADFNPQQLKALSERPEEKQKLLKNLREVLALASAARKEGIAGETAMKLEIDNIEKAILAFSYDKKLYEGKGAMPPFGMISEDQVKAYWSEDVPAGEQSWMQKLYGKVSWIWNGASGRWQQAEFERFLTTKIEFAKKKGQLAPDQEPTEDEIKQARDSFARTRITYYAAKQKLESIPTMESEAKRKEWEVFKMKTDIQVRLQVAQTLSVAYVQEVLAKSIAVTDDEIQKYIAEHPELTKGAEKLNTAKEVLKKAKEGADFAELAKQYSDDPGSKETGGLYEGILPGQFAAEFEAAVKTLKPGEITAEPVKTKFGYHIIKLEKWGEAKGPDGKSQPTYDARHVLISTMIKDPSNPQGQEMTAEQFVKAKLEKERQEAALKKVVDENPVSIPEDFKVPPISVKALEEMQEKQRRGMEAQKEQQEEMQRQMKRQQSERPAEAPAGAEPSDK